MSRSLPALGLLFAVLAGVGLGWVLAKGAGGPYVEVGLVEPGVAATPSTRAPLLEGVSRPPEGKARGAGGAGAAPARPIVPVAEEARVVPVFTLAGKALPEGRGQQVLRALTMLYAALGNVEEYERFVAQGIEAGLDLGDLLQMVDLLPKDVRIACIDRLLAGPFAGRDVSPVQLARLLADAGAKERALALLEARLDESLDSEAALALLAMDPKRGAARLLAHEGLGEADNDLLGNLSAALMEAGQPDLAWPFLERITARGEVPGGLLDRLAGNNPAMGLKVLERLMAEKREDGGLWNWQGRMLEAQGNTGAAFDAFHRAALHGNGRAALEGMLRADSTRAYEVAKTLDLSSYKGEDRGLVAVLALHQGASTEAFDVLAKGPGEAPGEYSLLNAIVRTDPQRAVSMLAEHLRGYEGDGRDEVTGAYANALRMAGRDAEARDAYLQALAEDASDAEWLGGLARVDAARALEALEHVRVGNDGEDWWQRCRAECLMRTGLRAEALTIYNRYEHDVYAAASLGLFDPQEGRRRLESVLAREPRNASGWIALGEMERDLGNLPAARTAFDQALRLEPHNLYNVVRWRQVQETAPPPTPDPAMR